MASSSAVETLRALTQGPQVHRNLPVSQLVETKPRSQLSPEENHPSRPL